MSITKESKQEIISKFAINKKDTGSAEVQIAVISERIKNSKVGLKDHITIYLPWFEDDYLFDFFHSYREFKGS